MELEYFRYRTYLGQKREPGRKGSGEGDHFKNFIDAVRSGSRDVLTADIEEGHLSSALCHLGNIAYRSRRTIHFEPATQKILGDEEASLLLTRQYRSPFEVRALV